MESEELARRCLPWLLMSRFSNLLLSLRKPIKYDRLVGTDVAGVFVPAASSFVVVDRVDYSYLPSEKPGTVAVKVTGGYAYAFLPNGEKVVFGSRRIAREVGTVEVRHSRKKVNDYQVSAVVRDVARLRLGGVFAAVVKKYARELGYYFEPGKRSTVTVKVRSGDAVATYTFEVTTYHLLYGDALINVAPGVVPAILHLIRESPGNVFPQAAVDALSGVVDRYRELGERVMPLVPVLQGTGHGSFLYVLGELEQSKPGGSAKTLATRRLGKGVEGSVILDEKNGKLLLRVAFRPFSPPALVALNYPPFNIAPLAVAANSEKYWDLVKAALDRAKKAGAKITWEYSAEYAALADATLTADDVRVAMREGYPSIKTLDAIAEKISALSDVADIVSHAYGRTHIATIDEILVNGLHVGESEGEQEKAPA